MTQTTYLGDSLIPAKFVQLAGQLTIGGMSTRSFDVVRDMCTMHLHQETGGVFVQRGEDHFYIAPIAIQCVELVGAVSADLPTQQETDSRTSPRTDSLARGVQSLADEVLAELGEAPLDAPPPPRKLRVVRKKN